MQDYESNRGCKIPQAKTQLGIIQNLEIDNVMVINDSNSGTHEKAQTANDTETDFTDKLRQLREKGIVPEPHSLTTVSK